MASTLKPTSPDARRRAWRVFLAFALAVGLIPGAALAAPETARAEGGASIQYIPEDSFTPEGFNWGIGFTGVDAVRGFTKEANIKQFYPRDYDELAQTGDSGFAARIGRTTQKGSFALRYTDATYKNDRVDAVVTLADWNYVEPVMSDGTSGWDEYWERDAYDTFQPGVFVNNAYQRTGSLIENLNFYTVGLTDLTVNVEFFYAGTNDPYEIKGHMTCIDLDVGQKFGFGGAITLAQVVAENDFLFIDESQNLVASRNYPCGGVEDSDGAISADPNDPLYKLGLVGAYFDTTSSRKGLPIELSFVSSWTGADSTAQSFFAMTNEFLTAPNPNDDITENGKLKVRKTADKTEGVSVGDVVTYTVDAPVHKRGVTCRNGYSYTDFEIVDVLPAEMRYVDGSGYLADGEGGLIEGAGEVVYEGHGDAGNIENTVKFEFTREFLANRMRMQGETYRFVFKATLTEYPADGALAVSNRAYAHVNNKGAYLSNSVETSLVPPKLKVEKTADAYEYEVGDVIHFASSFTQTEKNAQCREAVFSDNLPESLQLIPETVQATGIKNLPDPSIEGNRWSYSLDKFSYGDTLDVTFDAIATQSGNGVEQVNIAAAHANNCMDANDPAEVWTNTAKLSVEKTADYYEHYVGASDQDAGAVVYTVVVENTKDGTIANNLVISDESLPEGLKVGRTNAGDLMVDVEGVPESVAYPVGAEDSIHAQTDSRDVTCSTKPAGTGFTTVINHLPAHTPVTITYTCYPEDSIAGWEVENTATVRADNALPERDSALIWVNQPVLQVEKTSSLDAYTVGDFVTYHVKVTSNTPGTLGRNLVISDLLRTKGVELQRDSIKVWDSEGNDITDSCTIHTNRNKPTFIVETNRNIVNEAPERTFYRFGEQTEQGKNPLGEDGETAVFVDYTVAIADAALAGSTVENTALAVTDEPNTKTTDDDSVAVKGAKLQVTKESDASRYEVESEARYSIAVTQTREDAIAHGISVEDAFEDDALAAIDTSSVVVTGPDGEVIDDPDIVWKKNDEGAVCGFSLKTDVALRDEEALTVTYSAPLPIASDHVVNRVQAKAKDTAGSSAANDVAVIEPQADASLVKETNTKTAQVGDAFIYTLTAHATDGAIRDAVISDNSLPEGIEIDFNSLAASVNGKALESPLVRQKGNTFSIALGTLEKGDVAATSFTAKVVDESLAGRRIVNNATLASPSLDGERMAQAIVDVIATKTEQKASAAIEKTASAESARIGEPVSYSISAEIGETDLEDVRIADEGLPEGASIDYATLVVTIDGKRIEPAFASKDAQSFVLKLGKVSARAKASIDYEATLENEALAESSVENTATIESPTLPDKPHDTARVVAIDSPAPKVDVELVKTIDKEAAAVGEQVIFTIEATAIGGTVENALVTDSKMPAGAPIDFDSIQVAVDGKPIEAALDSDGNAFSAFIGMLQKGSTATITFAARIEDEALAGTKFSNRATLTSPSLEDARVAHAIVNVTENDDPGNNPVNTGAETGGKAKLGKTGDELMGLALKALPALLVATAALGIGALALRERRARKR